MSDLDLQNNELALNEELNKLRRFRLTLLSSYDEKIELSLPETPDGIFYFGEDSRYSFLSIVSKDSQWFAVCKNNAFFKNVPLNSSYEMPLFDKMLLNISVGDYEYMLLAEEDIPTRKMFANYDIRSDIDISIGSSPQSDICYNCFYISDEHAVISYHNNIWNLKSKDNFYGVYVNDLKVQDAELQIGDVVFVMGLRIIIGPNYLSINNGLGDVSVNSRILQDKRLVSSSTYSKYYNDSDENEEKFFNRAPRKRRNAKENIITIEGPPMSMSQQQIPLMLRMGSSMVMGGTAALSGNFVSLISSVVFPFLSSKFTENQKKEYEELRVSKYTEYLETKKQEINTAIEDERNYLNEKYPVVSDFSNVDDIMNHLWERRPCDSDFLQLRLGTGTRPLSTKIEYPPRGFELETDELQEKMYQLVESQFEVDNSPIVLSLIDSYICGLQGPKTQIINAIKSLILQLSLFHSYDEVKMVFLLEKSDLKEIDYVRYLPHVWDDTRTMRYIATNEVEAYSVGEQLKKQIEDDSDNRKDLQHLLKKRPYYIIFALNKKVFDGHEIFKELLQENENSGVSIIASYDGLPKECQKIITLESEKTNTSTTLGVDGGDDENFSSDVLSDETLKTILHKISNISLKKINQTQSMPKMVTFLEMFNVGRIEQLNPLKRWQDSNPIKCLAAPIGVGEDGSLFMLDLHEKRQGPHGLVAGMTGSGKSEFLITYILSMAVNYHPDEVAFVLIDYKGGGLASAFENPKTGVRLPHLVGTITNLDGASINRSLLAIESELIRRQKVFNKVANETNEGTMNIYTYQRLYREGVVSEPMPHLFIVSDEFAELKQQQPEFMEKLISAARIGRSLGVHLILATQKPSGVVNDQIRSNTKFRVCLRVQERSDSMDMLKRPEAAELTDTGRFYLQVGYNEFFAIGQSAWCGAQYEPSDVVAVRRDDSIDILDVTGQITANVKPEIKKTDSGFNQIVAIVKHLSNIAENQNFSSKTLLPPELPVTMDLDELQEKHLNENKPSKVCLGLVDDPQNLTQFAFEMDFETCGNVLVVGESGTGKTTLLQSIALSLAKQLTPSNYNFYCLDYSSRMMKQFKCLPHCGAVLQEEDSGSLDEFFKFINKIIAQRKQLFSSLEVDSFKEARKLKPLPIIVVFIDNFLGVTGGRVGDARAYEFNNYLKDSANYGVKYVVSCNSQREVSAKIRQECEEILCLHLKDKYDYNDVLSCKIESLPANLPGRGVVKINEKAYWVQFAELFAEQENSERAILIKNYIEELSNMYTERHIIQFMPIVDENAEYIDFAKQFGEGRIPLGYAKNTGKSVAIPLKQLSALNLYFGNEAGIKPIISNFLYSFQRENIELWVVKRKENSLFDEDNLNKINSAELKNVDFLKSDETDLRLLQRALINTINTNNSPNDNLENNPLVKTKVMVLIESITDFCSAISSVAMLSFIKIFGSLPGSDVYVLPCFEPEEAENVNNNALVTELSKYDSLLFGGRFDRQHIYDFTGVPGAEKQLQYNSGLMLYRQKIYPLLMPCGEIMKEKVEIDTENIFEI